MSETIFYTRHDGGITLFRNGRQSVVSSDHPKFDDILMALSAKEYDKLEMLMNPAKAINSITSRTVDSKIYVKNGEVFFNDTRNRKQVQLHGALVDRILNDLGKPGCERFANALIALLENISLNKVKDISGELYEWFLSGKNPITNDGCILAFKKVRKDFFDIYTGKFDNSPGKLVWMKQSDVDTDRHQTCSTGLHFCSLGYLSKYASSEKSRIVIVKVNPRHIFAIPTDYDHQKGRASEYYVVGEYVSNDAQTKEAFSDSFIDEDNFIKAAPEVKYTKSGLKVSLEARLERAGYIDKKFPGKVRVVEYNSGVRKVLKATATSGKLMSLETKSVRELVKTLIEIGSIVLDE